MTTEIFFFKNHAENETWRLVRDLFLFFKIALYEVKANGLQPNFNHFPQSSTCQTIKTKYMKFDNIDPEICSILIFKKRACEQFLYHILCMIIQEKYFSCYALLTDQISLPDCLYCLRYWYICVLQLFINQVVTSQSFEVNLIFLIKPFSYMTKKSRQKFK